MEESARKLRRAKGEALAAIDKLESLELKHWSLLRQFEADQQLKGSRNVAGDAEKQDATSSSPPSPLSDIDDASSGDETKNKS